MSLNDILSIATTLILSIGSGGLIVLALSSWLGKIWAERILSKEKNERDRQLEQAKRELDFVKETVLRFQNDKIVVYRAVVDVVARLLASLDSIESGRLQPDEVAVRLDEFNEQRIRVYGYLAMLAPQAVMDAQDELVDHLMLVAYGGEKYDWTVVRNKSLALINAVRADVGIDKNPVEYRGEL